MRKILYAGLVAAFVAVGCVTHEKEVVEKPAPTVVVPAQPPPEKVIVVPQ
jgi:hypothetical protein